MQAAVVLKMRLAALEHQAAAVVHQVLAMAAVAQAGMDLSVVAQVTQPQLKESVEADLAVLVAQVSQAAVQAVVLDI
jgi:hypothetical protein